VTQIKTITDEWIAKWRPCQEALNWWDKKEQNSIKILKKLIDDKQYDWANWTIVRVMTYKQYVSYAVYAAEQMIDIYEEEYPNNDRPRKAIEAAKRCIDNPSEENKGAARVAVAADAVWAAEAAAWVAETAAAAWAAKAAEAAAWAAKAAEAAVGAALQLKILNYGMKLLEEEHDSN